MVIKNLNEKEQGKTFVYLVRHGKFDLPQGQHPFNPHYPLNKRGIVQAKAVAKKFAKIKDRIDVFYASSMRRAAETAEHIGKQMGMKPKLSDKLWEFNKIRFSNEYYYHRHFWKHYIKHWQRMNEFNRILKENQGKTILIVGHGNLIKGILMNKRGISKDQAAKEDYKNCHISLLEFNGTKLESVSCFNSKNIPKQIKGNSK